MRNRSEHVKQAKKRGMDAKLPAYLQTNDAIAEPLKIPGIDYTEVNINGKGFERSLLWKLKYWSLMWVLSNLD